MSNLSRFYKDLEDRFRGDPAAVEAKFGVYDPLLERFDTARNCVALDLGCGRGEWLTRLALRGWTVRGVELDPVMASHARSSGLEVVMDDLLHHLQSCGDHSVDCLTAFHVIEHVPFDVLQSVLFEALRVVKPDGCLIFETPNPENLRVGTDLFYLDPTHQRPLSPELIQFMAQWTGFTHASILRVHSPMLYADDALLGTQFETFLHYSPDYALIASNDTRFSALDTWMAGDTGPSHVRFFQQANQLHAQLKSTDHWLAIECQRLEGLSSGLQTQINQLTDELARTRRRSLGWRLASWRDRNQRRLRSMAMAISHRSQLMLRWPLARLATIVVRRPWLKRMAVMVLHRVPLIARIVGRTLATERTAVGHIGIDGVQWRADSVVVLNTLEQELFVSLKPNSK
jgi:SAM-dependent methyltransferase